MAKLELTLSAADIPDLLRCQKTQQNERHTWAVSLFVAKPVRTVSGDSLNFDAKNACAESILFATV